MEATKCLKPSGSGSRIGDRASVQAATRVNAEQASKRTMCRPTRQPFRGRLIRPGEMSEEYAQLLQNPSTAHARTAFWQRLHERLAKLSNRNTGENPRRRAGANTNGDPRRAAFPAARERQGRRAILVEFA